MFDKSLAEKHLPSIRRFYGATLPGLHSCISHSLFTKLLQTRGAQPAATSFTYGLDPVRFAGRNQGASLLPPALHAASLYVDHWFSEGAFP